MSNLPQQYKDTKKKLEELRQEILTSSPVKKGTLIKDDKTGVHYRVDYVSVDDKGDLVISTQDIKNYSIAWKRCNNPTYKASKGFSFQVVADWEFDTEARQSLQDKLEETDSISERDILLGEIRDMNLTCLHEWKSDTFGERYSCHHCGCGTVKEKSSEGHHVQNIDLGEEV